jgi:hypothetical protein
VYIKTYRKEKSVKKQRGAHGEDLQEQEGKMAVWAHLEKGSHRMFE